MSAASSTPLELTRASRSSSARTAAASRRWSRRSPSRAGLNAEGGSCHFRFATRRRTRGCTKRCGARRLERTPVTDASSARRASSTSRPTSEGRPDPAAPTAGGRCTSSRTASRSSPSFSNRFGPTGSTSSTSRRPPCRPRPARVPARIHELVAARVAVRHRDALADPARLPPRGDLQFGDGLSRWRTRTPSPTV